MMLFIGIEAEGPYRGLTTLFVGEVGTPFDLIRSALEKYKVDCIYFGASDNTGISRENNSKLGYLLEIGYKVTVEFKPYDCIDVPEGVETVISIPVKKLGPSVKVVNGTSVYWFKQDMVIVNSLHDPLYFADKKI
jgi:hypothetical protein